MKGKYIAIILMFVFIISGCAQEKLDKREVIHLVLETAILKQQIPDYNLLKDKTNIVISSENIDENDLPTFADVNFEFLTPDQIQRKANEEGDFLYLVFSDFVYDNDSITVKLSNAWAKSMNSKSKYLSLSGGGFEVKYTKKNGEWNEEIISMWIS